MREITCKAVTAEIERLYIEAATVLQPSTAILLECAAESESSPAAANALWDIIENFKQAAESSSPICQNGGTAVVFADIGQDVHITGGSFELAVNEGVRRGYRRVMTGKNAAADSLRRIDTNDNMCALHVRPVEGDRLSLHVAIEGFNNMSAMKLFSPTADIEEIEDFIVDAVSKAGAAACPPLIIGIGLGGTVEQCALYAKRALLRNADMCNPDGFYAQMERRVLEKINRLGIGPKGLDGKSLGGKFTAIAVNIETHPVHTAKLPCVVSIGCYATRHARKVL